MEQEKKAPGYTDKLKVVKAQKVEAKQAAEVPLDPVEIVKALPGGGERRRICNRPDLRVFLAQGFRIVPKETAPVKDDAKPQ